MPVKKPAEVNKYEENRILVLKNEYLPRLSPALAAEIGLTQSILFLQIEFLIAISNNEKDGKRWTYQSTGDLKKMFPFWSRETINRGINSLRELGLIEVQNYNRHKYDRTRWFAIDRANAAKLSSIRLVGSAQFESQSSQFETDLSLCETTIPNTTSNITSDNSTKSTTEEKTLSASPSASPLNDTEISIDEDLEKSQASPHLQGVSDSSAAPIHKTPATEVFEDWREVMEYPEALFNLKTKRAVAGRLKEGYSVEALKLAIRGVLLSPFHMGKNDESMLYDSLVLICRDGEQIEKFKNLALARRIKSTDVLRKHAYAKSNAINGLPRKEVHHAFKKQDADGNWIKSEPYEVEVGGQQPRRDFAQERI
jgi:hypothetical protein